VFAGLGCNVISSGCLVINGRFNRRTPSGREEEAS
jgi:hypothetical protein